VEVKDTSEQFKFSEIVNILAKRYITILVSTVICIAVGFVTAFFIIKPSYEASINIIVGNSSGSAAKLDYDELMLYQKLVKTYCTIAKTDTVAEKTIEKMGLNMKVDDFQKLITVEPEADTQIFDIKVRANSKEQSVKIINTLSQVFIEEVKNMYPSDSIKVMDKIKASDEATAPNKKLYLIISAFVGLILSIVIIMLKEYSDGTLKTEKDVEEYLDYQVIGIIPKENDGIDNLIAKKSGITIEAFRTLRTNIEFSSIDNKVKAIMVTSSKQGEGKSSIAYILAFIMSQNGKKTLLIDCDLRRPRLHNFFGINNKKGISNILVGVTKWEEERYKTKYNNLYLIPGGTKPPNPTELLSSHKMKEFMETLKQSFDYIIIDTPPVGIVTDAQVLSTLCDGCIFVVAAGESVKEDTIKARNLLKIVNAKILGICLNKVKPYKNDEYKDYLNSNVKSKEPSMNKVKKYIEKLKKQRRIKKV
jgi:capsular exopolysaccharide synthesis family protein